MGAGGLILLFPLAQFSLINPTPIRLIWVKLAVAILFAAYIVHLRRATKKAQAWETERGATG